MVKGTTRQVLVVKGSDTTMFEQAIFLVRDSILENGGVTEEALLQEARHVCHERHTRSPILQNILWVLTGASSTGLIWILSMLF